jgi:transposase InsO family protein
MPMQGSLSIERMCELANVSRAGFYRSLQEQAPLEESMEVRSAIQRTALEHRRRYGYRRVTAELRRRGMLVNHKRVARIMREDNLLAVQPKQFVTTTDSNHGLEIYLNLASRMKLTGIDQLWVADITWMPSRARLSAGNWSAPWRAVWRAKHCRRRSCHASRYPVWCIIRIAECSTLRRNTLPTGGSTRWCRA